MTRPLQRSSESKDGPARSRKRPSAASIPLVEWIAAALGLALVCTTIGFMLYKGMTRSGTPPDVEIRAEAVRPVHGGYVVTIRALNRGETTAADVRIEGQLRNAAGVAETSELTFQYLPPLSSRKGGLFFSRNPAEHQIELRAKGYEVP